MDGVFLRLLSSSRKKTDAIEKKKEKRKKDEKQPIGNLPFSSIYLRNAFIQLDREGEKHQ
jgi:hypothetical protein